MNKNFKENIQMFFTELMQDSLKNLRECDENYNDIQSSNTKNSNKFYDILNSLNEHQKQYSINFLEERTMLNSIEMDWFYLQGYKDCIKLLKLIEAI